MKILAIETSAEFCSIAVSNQGKIYAEHKHAPREHGRLILELIAELLTKADLKLSALDAIAFGKGPGSFTGIRIATSIAQGLGYAQDLPLISVSTLATLAQTAYQQHGWKELLVATDARKNEVYAAYYRVNDKGFAELITGEIVCPPHELPFVIAPQQQIYGVGSGWQEYSDQLDQKYQPQQIAADITPEAASMIPLAQHSETIRPEEVELSYLRRAV